MDGSSGGPGYLFFLSYAHTPEHGWVKRLFTDLKDEIVERTDLPPGRVGFMDASAIPLGSDWRDEVWDALASCQVFVPLYSPRYFSREECGKEWHAFAQRQLDHRAHRRGAGSAVVPALWTPVATDALPDVARRLQINHASFGTAYCEEGIYTLIKISTYHDDYVSAVQKLARRIIEVAGATRLEPCDRQSLGAPRNVFDIPGRRRPADRRLAIIVAAPSVDQLPDERDPSFYGSSCMAWNPYHPRSRQSLAEYAAGVARMYSYEPTVLTLEQGFSFVERRDPDAGLGLLLVDPWAVHDVELAEHLQRLDALGVDWVETMLPWNSTDLQTMHQGPRLRAELRRILPARFGAGPSSGANGVRVRSLEEFRFAFDDVVEHAVRRFLTSAQAHPPDGPREPTPRLMAAPDADRTIDIRDPTNDRDDGAPQVRR